MNNDFFEYHIYIKDFSRLLLWLMFVCFLGVFISGWAMSVMSRFFLTDKGRKFSIIDFELPYSFKRFKEIIDHISEKTKDTVRMNLKLDYYFMPFAYLLLFFGGWYIMQRHHLLSLHHEYYKILFIPFAAWLFDIIENKMALSCLEKLTQTKSRFLFLASLIKWLLVFGYIIALFIMDFNKN